MLSSGVFDNFRRLGLSHIHVACQEVPLFQVIFPSPGVSLAHPKKAEGLLVYPVLRGATRT